MFTSAEMILQMNKSEIVSLQIMNTQWIIELHLSVCSARLRPHHSHHVTIVRST